MAAGFLWIAVTAHIKRSCILMDTPYLPFCGQAEVASAPANSPRDRVRANPGDSGAWAKLLLAEKDRPQEVLKAAAMLAPNDANVLPWRAAQALEQDKLDEGVALLVRMLQMRRSPEAAKALAQLLTTGKGVELLIPHASTAESWLPFVLHEMRALKVPPGQALPVVARALDEGVLTDRLRQEYMRSLKDAGQWLDAYGLWLASQKQQLVPLLYNGGFDQAIEQDGFDWEISAAPRSKAGVIIEQQVVARRGLVLEIEFTGRGFAAPVVRQYVFAPPGSYRLRGEYMASKLRSENGLSWNVVCTSSKKPAPSRSLPLNDTGGVWKTMEVEFTIPDDCGPVASVQLEPKAAFEAAAGMRGMMAFDNLGLTRAAN